MLRRFTPHAKLKQCIVSTPTVFHDINRESLSTPAGDKPEILAISLADIGWVP